MTPSFTFLVILLVVISGLALMILSKPLMMEAISRGFTRIWVYMGSRKRLAQLNDVICHHCNKGRALYNPVYRMFGGTPHIAGICNSCGHFVCAPLQ